MRCEDVENQLNARADGELGGEVGGELNVELDDKAAAELAAHLAECASCRMAGEGLQAMDAELRRAFIPRREAATRLAENVLAAMRSSAVPPVAGLPSPLPAPQQEVAWWPAVVGLAAGFLLAVALFRPWQRDFDAPVLMPAIEPVAHLAVASGPVEVRPWSQVEFFRCPTEAPIEKDSIVRTGPSAQCEISLEDGNAVRLDCNTEVTLHGSDVVEVNRGRLWSANRPGSKGFEIQSGGGAIVPGAAAELTVDCQPHAVRLFVVEGTVNVRTGGESTEVGAGERVRIVDGRLEDDPEWSDALLETAWVNSLIALSDSEHPELVERVSRLLAKVGAAKLSLLYEDELRRLGDEGVPPLLAYLDSTRGSPQAVQRAAAARIVADVAESRWIADLIALLTDANAEVRFHAARGLDRLTGRDQGCSAETWRTGSWGACEGAHRKWLDWWTANRDRFPEARREVHAPATPSL